MRFATIRRVAWRQFRTELRLTFATPTLIANLAGPVIVLVVCYVLVGPENFDELAISVGSFALAGVAGAMSVLGVFQVFSEMWTERNDSTLLRLRSLPDGVTGWLLAKTGSAGVLTGFVVAVALIGGALLMPSLRPSSVGYALGVVAVVVASYFATLPWGVVLGSFARGPYGMMLVFVLLMVMLGGSGTAFPIVFLPEPLQWVAAATPFYWSAHATRAFLLPPEAGTLELTGAFAPGITFAVLAVWAVVGYLLAARLMRVTIQKETVGSVAAIRDRVIARGY